MTAHLLDANVLIALTISEHEHHGAAAAWASSSPGFALCPVVEGALVRFLVRLGERPSSAQAVLAALYASDRCEFWPDSNSYATTPLDHVTGHRQANDAYLIGIAASRNARLVTFDRALAATAPETVELLQ